MMFSINIIRYTCNLYLLRLTPDPNYYQLKNNDTYVNYILALKNNKVTLKLILTVESFYDDIRFNIIEKSIMFILDNNIAKYVKTETNYCNLLNDNAMYLDFKDVHSQILLKLI